MIILLTRDVSDSAGSLDSGVKGLATHYQVLP